MYEQKQAEQERAEQEKRGAEAIHYLLSQGIDEEALTIRAIQDAFDLPALPRGYRALRFFSARYDLRLE